MGAGFPQHPCQYSGDQNADLTSLRRALAHQGELVARQAGRHRLPSAAGHLGDPPTPTLGFPAPHQLSLLQLCVGALQAASQIASGWCSPFCQDEEEAGSPAPAEPPSHPAWCHEPGLPPGHHPVKPLGNLSSLCGQKVKLPERWCALRDCFLLQPSVPDLRSPLRAWGGGGG